MMKKFTQETGNYVIRIIVNRENMNPKVNIKNITLFKRINKL